MSESPPDTGPGSASRQTLEIRKYPNRRYYDATRSTHVTLEQIHELIRAGHDIRVTDSKTGEDITGKVLAQIILDQDPMKLAVFPDALLHKLIRTNEQLVEDFVEKYFNQALDAFLRSQKQFEEYLRHAVGLNPALQMGPQLAQAMMNPFVAQFLGQQTPPPAENEEARELRRQMQELREQMAELRRRPENQPPSPGSSGSSGHKRGSGPNPADG
jgi:polyhydroxyalkanoate synthesis repressor PhaR